MINKSIFIKIYELTKMVPIGRVATYGSIAKHLKINPQIVGWALHANQNKKIPCHRIVDRNGRVAKNYKFGGEEEQRKKLEREGVRFIDRNHINLTEYLFIFK